MVFATWAPTVLLPGGFTSGGVAHGPQGDDDSRIAGVPDEVGEQPSVPPLDFERIGLCRVWWSGNPDALLGDAARHERFCDPSQGLSGPVRGLAS